VLINRIERRNQSLYGTLSLLDIGEKLQTVFAPESVTIEIRHSNCEGALIDILQEYSDKCVGIVFNPGALTHYSYALRDAISDTTCPVIEVHFSNIHARDPFRQHSVTAASCRGIIAGFGWHGVQMGIAEILRLSSEEAVS
jgi:3-dehydroquinate dehydratase-2